MAAANKALKIDSELGEAHISLAYVYHEYYWDWEKAEAEFVLGLQLNPSYATGRQWYAEFLARMGRFDESLIQVRKSRELDPLALIIQTNEGWIEYLSGNRDLGIKQLKSTVELYPNALTANWMLSIIYRTIKSEKEAYKYTMIYIRNAGFSNDFIKSVENGYNDSGLDGFNRAYITALADDENSRPPEFAETHAYLGEYEKTIDWLEEAYRQKNIMMTSLLIYPSYSYPALRSNPRFQAILKKMNFPKL